MSEYYPEEGFDYPEEGSVEEKVFVHEIEGSEVDIESQLDALEVILEKNNGKRLSQQTLAALEIPNGFRIIEVCEFNGRDYKFSYSVISETERYNEFGDLLDS